MKIKMFPFIVLFSLIVLFPDIVNAQLNIRFGDNPQRVASITTYLVNQINSSRSEISARQKILYNNGQPYEIIVYKNNISNLFGTLTYPFSVKEHFIFCDNSLCKILKEVPEKSVSEIKTAMLNSSQIIKLGSYMFSEDYEEMYSVFLNSSKTATIQSTSSRKASFPMTIQQKVNQILAAKDKKEKELMEEKMLERRAAEKKREQIEGEKRKENEARQREIIEKNKRNAPTYAKIDERHIMDNRKRVVLFCIEYSPNDTGIFYAVPFVIFENKQYKPVPYCEISPATEKARNECKNAEEILWPAVTEGATMFILDNGEYKGKTNSLGKAEYGANDWILFSAVLKYKPKGQLLTNNATIGLSYLKDVSKRLKLKKRVDKNGNRLEDKFIGKVDIDRDGVAELIYWCEDYEGGFYQIYSYKNEVWTLVFEGGYQGV